MFSLEEMTTWSPEDIEVEIRKLLPPEWTFSTKLKDGWFGATILSGLETLWTDWHADRRTLFLNAFGWLWVREQKPRHPAWKRRTGEVRPVIMEGLVTLPGAEDVPDPEDLDPEVLASVYGVPRGR